MLELNKPMWILLKSWSRRYYYQPHFRCGYETTSWTGQTVSVGQTLFEIVNPDQLEIQAKLPIEQQSALKVGSSIQYQIQGNSKQLHAILTRISPVADQDSRQIEFFASPKEAIDSLSIGAFINGIILHNDSNQGQTIPLDSIQNLQHDPFVWVIRNQTIQKVKIQWLSNDTTKISL